MVKTDIIDPQAWLQQIAYEYQPEHVRLIRHACLLSESQGNNQLTPTGKSCLQQGIEMADLLYHLGLGHEAMSAAIIYNNVQYAGLSINEVHKNLGGGPAKLVAGVQQMDIVRDLQDQTVKQVKSDQIENLRKMLIAMVDDARVVLIKLAERACILQDISQIPQQETLRRQIAKETMDIYAPLANRLGVSEIKWKLEDLSFRFLYPDTYKEIAGLLAMRRTDREAYVNKMINKLKQLLKDAHIVNYKVMGRAKHIYSIYRKMQRKNLTFDQLYDTIALRILVPKVQDCYTALSSIHSTWPHIDKEFDDYVAKPKPNGYRSIHTAVVGPEEKNVEVQIRTYTMHQESELGVAAHWRYKEGSKQRAGKAVWLRQLLEWQREVAQSQETLASAEIQAFEDRVYVFTPAGDVIDLDQESTPLDFAYHIHTEVGHRCRGAKINGHIVPLSYQLQTGDKVDIITAKESKPSRDWLNPELGFIKSSRARNKIHQWFKHQDYETNYALGKDILDREQKRLHFGAIDLAPLAARLNLKSVEDLIAGLGKGDVKLGQVLNFIQQIETVTAPKPLPSVAPGKTKQPKAGELSIHGVGNLLTQIARCCKPVPGDPIIGFITSGRGVTIHRQDCPNIFRLSATKSNHLIEVNWGSKPASTYPVDIYIKAYDRKNLIRDITTVLANEKVNVIAMSTTTDKQHHSAYTKLTIELSDVSALTRVLDKIQQLPNVFEAHRQVSGTDTS